MVVIVDFDKGLDLGPLGDLLLAHGGGDFSGVTVNAGDQSVAVRPICRPVINVLPENRKQRQLGVSGSVRGSHTSASLPHLVI